MTDLLSELEAVVWLAEKATPGPWHRHTDCPGKCCWHVFTAQDGIYGPETDNAGDSSLINSPEMAEEDATYIVALSNFFRTHHAEIAAAVRDAAYGRALRTAMEAEYQAAKESRKGGKQEAWITTYSLLRRLKVAADHLTETGIPVAEQDQPLAAMRAGEGEG